MHSEKQKFSNTYITRNLLVLVRSALTEYICLNSILNNYIFVKLNIKLNIKKKKRYAFHKIIFTKAMNTVV